MAAILSAILEFVIRFVSNFYNSCELSLRTTVKNEVSILINGWVTANYSVSRPPFWAVGLPTPTTATAERTNRRTRSDCRADEQKNAERLPKPDEQANRTNQPNKNEAYCRRLLQRAAKKTFRSTFCNDNIKLDFYRTFFDEMEKNNLNKKCQLAFSLISREDSEASRLFALSGCIAT